MLRKYASLEVLEAWRAGTTPDGLRKAAHRVAFDYEPRPGYLYVRSRMISSRTNDNHDTFPAGEIEGGYRTFLGKPVFVNHHNANHRRARGVIVAIALHRDHNPDGSPDTWVEGLMEIDALRFPKLAQAILAGKINRTSMGVDVEWSRCSACGNKATSPAEYCRHLPALKGKKIRKRNQQTGKIEEKLIHEICAGLSFFENSLLVEDPADPTAVLLDHLDTRGLRLAAMKDASSPSRRHQALSAQAAGPKYPDPAGHPWFQANPVSSSSIVAAYHGTTDDEKVLGDRWYADAHHVAKAIANGDAALGAGLLSAYSPQTAWPVNMFNASRAVQGDPPGPGSGAMNMHQKPAIRMLAGEHHSKVLTAPKTAAFAHLIEHGGDTDEDKASGTSKVVVDRHAMSVAVGRRLSKAETESLPLGVPHYYNHVAQAYRDAAKELSAHYGREIAPHKVQAATWLRQIRLNQAEDSSGERGGGGRGRVVTHTRSRERWRQYHQEAHPGGIPEENMHYHGQRKQAYGETRVPPQVDTLRMEECPVCGEHDVWSGDRCPVCGFIVPPSLFRDPDVNKAQQVRQELDQAGEVVTQPGAPGDPSTQQMGSDPDASDQLMHPDQLAPDGVPTVQGEGGPAPAAGTDGQPPAGDEAQEPGQEEEAEGDAEIEQGEEDQELGQEEEAEGQELAQEGEEDQLAPEPPGSLVCPACGATFAPDMAAQPGVPCPACRQGALEPAAGPQKEQEGPSGGKDMSGSKTAAALAKAQAHRIAALAAENEVLREQLSFLARAAGADQHLEQIRVNVMQRHADVLNPASPVPDPSEEPPTQTTEQALMSGGKNPAGQGGTWPRGTGHTQDDPSRPGATPGAMENVPAVQTTTAITPGVELQTPPATNLVDVTAPVQGTNPSQDGGVPIEQRRIETDVRIDPDPLKAHGPGVGGQGDNGAAFPWVVSARGGQQRQAASTEDESHARLFASMRLAKMRVQAGLAHGDELTIGEQISADASLSTPMIEHEIDVLARVRPAAPAPRPMARQATRQAPSLASVGAVANYAPAAVSDDLDGSDLFL